MAHLAETLEAKAKAWDKVIKIGRRLPEGPGQSNSRTLQQLLPWLSEQGQQALPHTQNPRARDGHPNKHYCGYHCDEDGILNRRGATLVAPKTLEHTHTLADLTPTLSVLDATVSAAAKPSHFFKD